MMYMYHNVDHYYMNIYVCICYRAQKYIDYSYVYNM